MVSNIAILTVKAPNYIVSGDYFETLQEAYEFIVSQGNEGTIKVNQNNIDGSNFVVGTGKTIILDTAGKTITKTTNKIDVKYTVLDGERDLEEGKVTVKDMLSGEQELVDIDNVVDYIKGKLY